MLDRITTRRAIPFVAVFCMALAGSVLAEEPSAPNHPGDTRVSSQPPVPSAFTNTVPLLDREEPDPSFAPAANTNSVPAEPAAEKQTGPHGGAMGHQGHSGMKH